MQTHYQESGLDQYPEFGITMDSEHVALGVYYTM